MIESIILKNTATLQSITVDRDQSEFVLGELDLGTVEGAHHSYKYVNQVGVHIEGTTLEERQVSISGWVIGDTYEALKRNKSVLNKLVNPLYEIDLLVSDRYKLVFKPDYSIKYSVAYKENNDVLCKFLIQGTCANPMFQSRTGLSTLIATTIPKLHFPLVIPKQTGMIMGLREPSLLATIHNSGDIGVGMVVRFSCTAQVVNPSLLNVLTREYIRINKVMAPGETIEVSTVSGAKYIKGFVKGSEYNYFSYWDFESSWMTLEAGENVLKYDADSGADDLEVLVTFTPQYLEVQ